VWQGGSKFRLFYEVLHTTIVVATPVELSRLSSHPLYLIIVYRPSLYEPSIGSCSAYAGHSSLLGQSELIKMNIVQRSIGERKIDLIYLTFFIIHIPIMLRRFGNCVYYADTLALHVIGTDSILQLSISRRYTLNLSNRPFCLESGTSILRSTRIGSFRNPHHHGSLCTFSWRRCITCR